VFELLLVLNPRNEGSVSEGNRVRKSGLICGSARCLFWNRDMSQFPLHSQYRASRISIFRIFPQEMLQKFLLTMLEGLEIHGRNLSLIRGALKIDILINKKLVKTVAIKRKGRIYNFLGAFNAEFRANRLFVPRHFGSSDDSRQLAYIIDNLELIRGENYDKLAVG
jgi:hypothetical protein